MKDYIHRLDNFDGPAVGEIAAGYEMFEEAFEIYKKFNLKTQAIKVLLDSMDDMDRAQEYATKVIVVLPLRHPALSLNLIQTCSGHKKAALKIWKSFCQGPN